MILLQSPKGSFIFFDYAVVFLAVIANCLVLTAVVGGRFGLSGYRRFLISLTVSDLYICLVNLLTFIYQIWMLYSATSSAEKCGANFLRALQLAGFFANLLNLCGMSVDHFFGIVYPMQYRYLMSKKVARMAVICIWILSFSLAFLDFPVNMILYSNFEASHQQSTVRLDLQSQDMFNNSPFGDNFATEMPIGLIFPTENNKFSQISMESGDDSANIQFGYSHNVTLSKLERLKESEAKTAADLLGQAMIDDNSKDSVLQLETADIESFLESMINQNNPLDLNFLENETNSSSPLNRILLVLQTENQNMDWCTFFSANKMWLEVCVMVLTLLCFAFLIICYGIIFKKVSDSVDTSGRSMKKLIVTTIILLGAFTICWLPFMTFETAMLLIFQYDRDAKNHQTKSFLVNFFFLHNMFNSLLMTYPLVDPIIYAARVPAVQRYILFHYCKYFPCCRSCVQRADSRHSGGPAGGRINESRAAGDTDAETTSGGRRVIMAHGQHQSFGESMSHHARLPVNHVHLDDFHHQSHHQRRKAHSVCSANSRAINTTHHLAVNGSYDDVTATPSMASHHGHSARLSVISASVATFSRLSIANCSWRRQSSLDSNNEGAAISNNNTTIRGNVTPRSRVCLYSCFGRKIRRNFSGTTSENKASNTTPPNLLTQTATVTTAANETFTTATVAITTTTEEEPSTDNNKNIIKPADDNIIKTSPQQEHQHEPPSSDVNIVVFNDDDDGSIAYEINL